MGHANPFLLIFRANVTRFVALQLISKSGPDEMRRC
jgi:hypothetical protein